MRIEIKRLRSLLNSKADNVMNLETRRLQLETVENLSFFFVDDRFFDEKRYF